MLRAGVIFYVLRAGPATFQRADARRIETDPFQTAHRPIYCQILDRITTNNHQTHGLDVTAVPSDRAPSRRRTDHRGGSPPFKSPVPPDLQGSFSKTATSRDGQRTVTAFQFPGAVVLSYLDLGRSRDQSRRVRRRIIGPESESFVPETQLHTQPDSESVPSSIPASVNPGIVNPGIEDGWRGRGLMAFTEMRENWTEGHPKSTDLTWMDTQTEDNDKPDDNDKLPDLIQIDGD